MKLNCIGVGTLNLSHTQDLWSRGCSYTLTSYRINPISRGLGCKNFRAWLLLSLSFQKWDGKGHGISWQASLFHQRDAPFHRWKATGLRVTTAFHHLTESKEEFDAPSINSTIASSHSPILPSDCIVSLIFVLLHCGRSLGVITNTAPLHNPQGPVFKNYCGEHLFLTTRKSLMLPRAIP